MLRIGPVTSAVAILAAVACGGDGSATLRDATEADLPRLVLQQNDLVGDFSQLPDEGPSGRRIEGAAYESSAAYVKEFELARAEASPGQALCVGSGAFLYDSRAQTAGALGTFEETVLTGTVVSGENELEKIDAPDLGGDAISFRSYSPTAAFCSFDEMPSETIAVAFVRQNIMAVVSLHVEERGAKVIDAADLARRQLELIDSVLKGNQE